MNKIFLSAGLAALFFLSCINGPGKFVTSPSEVPEPVEESKNYIITDYKNRSRRNNIPEWLSLWLDSGIHAVEAMSAFQDYYLFISSNEGSNFTALNLWNDGFSPELDFPRMAAARIEARFSEAVFHPDQEYGSFFEALIRTASDTPWRWMVKEDDFWIRRKFIPGDDEPDREDWEFFILVSMEKTLFASQMDSVFQNVKPNSRITEEQARAIDRVKDRFFDEF